MNNNKDNNNSKGQTIFLSVVGIATLLVAIIGATFAWFSATVTGNDTASSVVVETATIGITYTNGDEVKLANAVPGAAVENKKFTVAAATGATVDQNYTINWVVTKNDFNPKTDLVYNLSGVATGGGNIVSQVTNDPLPAEGTTEIGKGKLTPGASHEYTLGVKFIDTSSDQNSNQGKKFQAKIQVVADNISAAS